MRRASILIVFTLFLPLMILVSGCQENANIDKHVGKTANKTPVAPAADATLEAAFEHPERSSILPSSPLTDSGPPKQLNSVHYINADDGYGVTGTFTNGTGSLLHTTDGGQTWSRIDQWPGGFSHLSWNGNIGVATGEVLRKQGGVSVQLAVTTDNGASWKLMKPSLAGTGKKPRMYQEWYAHVAGNGELWLMIAPEAASTGDRSSVWLSRDGGQTFHAVSLPANEWSTGGFSSYRGYVALSAYNAKTRQYHVLVGDGKKSWAKLGPNTQTPIYAVNYTNATQIYAGGGHLPKFGLKPGMEIWSLHPDNPQEVEVVLERNHVSQPIVAMNIHSGGRSYILTGGISMGGNLPAPGPLFISEDGGFHVKQTNVGGTSLDVLSSHVWVAGNRIGVDVSTDGGVSWHTGFQPSAVQARTVQFLDRQTGFVLTQVGVYETTDGGQHWSLRAAQVKAGQRLDVVSPTQLYRWRPTGIEESIDGGGTWQPVPTPRAGQIDSFDALPGGVLSLAALPLSNSNHPFHDDYWRSTDNGAHWSKMSDPFQTQQVTLDFVNPKLGIAYAPEMLMKGETRDPMLFSTTDGGMHWQTQAEPELAGAPGHLSANAQGLAISGNKSVRQNGKLSYTGYVGLGSLALNHYHVLETETWQPDSIAYPTPEDIWFTDVDGHLFHSNDGGKTFRQIWIVP